MVNVKLEKTLLEIKKGDELERERLIRFYQSYILSIVGKICKKYVSWSSDEASIGLIAFNRAIDTFDYTKGRTFPNYVYLLIERDLIDNLRKERRHIEVVSKNDNVEQNEAEMKLSLESYEQSKETSFLVEEILELDEKIQKFNIFFRQLENHCPKHHKTRLKIMEMAYEFIRHDDMVEELLRKSIFPITKFTKRTGIRPKMVERHRKYLITIIMIKLHPEWRQLSMFVQDGTGSEKL